MLALVVHRRNRCARRELGVAAQFEIKKNKKKYKTAARMGKELYQRQDLSGVKQGSPEEKTQRKKAGALS